MIYIEKENSLLNLIFSGISTFFIFGLSLYRYCPFFYPYISILSLFFTHLSHMLYSIHIQKMLFSCSINRIIHEWKCKVVKNNHDRRSFREFRLFLSLELRLRCVQHASMSIIIKFSYTENTVNDENQHTKKKSEIWPLLIHARIVKVYWKKVIDCWAAYRAVFIIAKRIHQICVRSQFTRII